MGGCQTTLLTVHLGMCLAPQGSSEMKYALKRLITGLGGGREAARPCYSLALAQVRWWPLEGVHLCWSERWGVSEQSRCPSCKGSES